MIMTYIYGYNTPKDIFVERIESNLGLLALLTDTGVVYEAEFVTYDDGKITAHLSENA
jgi:hypothetical protein